MVSHITELNQLDGMYPKIVGYARCCGGKLKKKKCGLATHTYPFNRPPKWGDFGSFCTVLYIFARNVFMFFFFSISLSLYFHFVILNSATALKILATPWETVVLLTNAISAF